MNRVRIICITLTSLVIGCAGYVDQTARMRGELRAGNPEGALSSINKELGIEKLGDDPDLKNKNAVLLMLERATILQALERHKPAAQTFQRADDQLELLDLTSDKVGNIGKFLYSDSATVYKAPAFEKLMVNGLNMLNYLVMANPNGAKIEARRFENNRSYLKERNLNDNAISAFCSYLAGIAFEAAGEADKAMRFYADAFEGGGLPQLDVAIKQLHQKTGATDERVRELYDNGEGTPSKDGQLVIFVQEGLVPRKVAKRVPIGMAITRVAAHPAYQYQLSAKERAQANRVAAQGLVTWINYPSLEVDKTRPSRIRLLVNQGELEPNLALNITAASMSHFKKQEGLILVAALSRTVTRAIAGAVANKVARKAQGNGAIGLLLSLAVQGTMVAADTPDTRAWSSLPARIHHLRLNLPPGEHTITIKIGNRNFKKRVLIKKNGITIMNFSRLRAG